MATSNQPRGRGRLRSRIEETSSLSNELLATAVSSTTDVNTSSTTNDMQTIVTSLTATSSVRGHGRGRGRLRQRTQEASSSSNELPAMAVSNTTDDMQAIVTSPTTTSSDHRIRCRQEIEVPDPQWTVSDLSSIQFMSNDRPSKPKELGRVGDPITVIVNYFPITKFPQKGIVYHYDIQIRNKGNQIISHHHRRAIYTMWKKKLCNNHPEIDPDKIVFDNQTAIFTVDQPLPNIDEIGIGEYIMGPNRANRQQRYEVSIKQVGNPIDLRVLHSLQEFAEMETDDNIELNDFQTIKQMLSIVLHEHCSSYADFIFGRLFFSQPAGGDRYGGWDLGLGKAMWRGFYSCLIFSKGHYQLLMNLDVSHRVFTKKQPFFNFLREVMLHSPCGKRRYGRGRDVREVTMEDTLKFFDEDNNPYYNGEINFLLEHCKNLPVHSQVADKIIGYAIQGLGRPASRQTFEWKQKNIVVVTVENYYKQHHGLTLEHPTLPTLEMKNGSFVPMEYVYVEPIRMKKITDEQRAMLCLKSSMKPFDYHQSIKEIRNNPKQQCFEQDPFLAAWNLNVDVHMIKVPARILPMPDVICNDSHRVTHEQSVQKGVWNQTKTPFFKPTAFPSVWALINLSSSMNRAKCEEFYNELSNVAADRGIQCPAPVIYEEYDARTNSIKQIIGALKIMMQNNNDCKFFIVILPEVNSIRDLLYAHIKELCELEFGFGIATQMIKLKENECRSKWNYSRLNNILMKINNKLDGINSIIGVSNNIQNFFSKGYRTMYVGIDLSHGSPDGNRRRSTVAVVASVGNIPIRYLKEIYIQEQSSETRGESWENIKDMKEIMKSLIHRYKEHQCYPPNAIVIYRDGISTSEFDTVFENELTAIRDACVELSPAYRPYLTYIVVNKRHHTRLFPNDLNDLNDENVEAGTVVDSTAITNPTTYDFFLNSHHGKKGTTSRPAHYHVLYDDNKLQPDQVQMITYALCYLHGRCTSSISIPAPVKYADLLAYRATKYKNIDNEFNVKSSTVGQTIPINQEVNIGKETKSKRIVLSSKLAADCPFFL